MFGHCDILETVTFKLVGGCHLGLSLYESVDMKKAVSELGFVLATAWEFFIDTPLEIAIAADRTPKSDTAKALIVGLVLCPWKCLQCDLNHSPREVDSDGCEKSSGMHYSLA